MSKNPEYETPLEEALWLLFILHSSDELASLRLLLLNEQNAKEGLNGKMIKMLEDIALVRADKGVII